MRGFVDLIRQSNKFKSINENIEKKNKQFVTGLSGSHKSLLIASTAEKNHVTLVITHNHQHAERMARDLESLAPKQPISVFASLELLPHEGAVIDWQLKRSRLNALESIQNEGSIVLTSIQALSEALFPPDIFYDSFININLDSRIDITQFTAALMEIGYERVDMIEGYGQFSIRGGIIDIYPYTAEHPFRIELFDDEVDSLRIFNIDTQRSVENKESISIGPARERLFNFDKFDKVKGDIWDDAKKQADNLYDLGDHELADALLQKCAHHLDLLEQGVYFEGIDQYLVYFSEFFSLLDYLPSKSSIIIDEPLRVREQSNDFLEDIREMIASLLEKGKVLPSLNLMYQEWNALQESIATYPITYISMLDKRIQGMDKVVSYQIQARPPEHFHGKLDDFIKKISHWRKQNYRILLAVSSAERAKILTDFLKESDIPCQFVEELTNQMKAGNCVVTVGDLQTGLDLPEFKVTVCTELEIYGKRRSQTRTRKIEERLKVTQADLKVGDYVVHVNHGIGKYLGVETLEVAGVHKDYLLVKYSGEDKLYVPTDQIDLLQRYVALDDKAPKLSKLGGNEWTRAKKRVKQSVQEMAEGLIKLYAEREAIQGYQYSPDTPWQQEFEDAFPYQETPDQLKAIQEVKLDMQKPRPMDRLLCGDVGYGKTEVAIRAAFKAVAESKQVAVLVPTTILAQQHHRTFVDRFEKYPINIGVLSRFQSQREQAKLLQDLKSGIVDIVIGTHRLLSKDIKFHDLGLVIVDEEQRFGVTQKEKLKAITKKVDVLTLSATPIPRTLHMAMVGVRDMSLIGTPPEDRYPIRTYVVEYDEEIIRKAVSRELARQGQVYFVFNRIQGIEKMYRELQDIVPEARIAIGHGRMDESRLEQVMLDFYDGEYDVLLCTTIIETGMDISNVNTLVVYDSDRLGLAQLYQLRGRVGRTNRVAYAYFNYKKDKILSEDAEKRLQAIKEFTELGSGIKIAMRDLEIRGAGNILGPEQHGFITSVGFEMYCKLLDESIKEIKGETAQQPPEPVLDLNVDAYISDTYVTDPKQKVEMYKKIMAIHTLEEADHLADEIEDRFGEPPQAVSNLLKIAKIKVLARLMGIAMITVDKGLFVVKLLAGLSIETETYNKLLKKYRGKIGYQAGRTPQLKVKARDQTDAESLSLLFNILADAKEMQGVLAGKNE